MSRPMSVSLLALALGARAFAAEPFGLGVPSADPPAARPPSSPAAPPEAAAVPRGFSASGQFMEVVNAIEGAAVRELRALNLARAAEGLPPLPYDVRVSVIGSSVTGFSENPNKERRAFGRHSDIDFLLESDSLVEAARRQGLDRSKGHVHPKRLGQLLPELQRVAGEHSARLPNPVTIGVSDTRAAREAGWSSQNIVVDVGPPRQVDGRPEPTPTEGREVLTRAEARELEIRVMDEVERLRREAKAARQLAGPSTSAEATRLRREAGAFEAAARHMEHALAEPLRRALGTGEPIPASEVRARLDRYKGAKIDGVRVPMRIDLTADALVRIPEPPAGRARTRPVTPGSGTAGTTARSAALAYLRDQAARNFATPEGRAAYEAYLAVERLPPETSLPELMRRPELSRLSPATQAEIGRVVPGTRGRPGGNRGGVRERPRLRVRR